VSVRTRTKPKPPARGITKQRSGSGYRFKIDGEYVPGVTKVLGMLPRENLINWAARVTAEYAVDHWAELSAMLPTGRLNTLTSSRWDNTSKPALARGTEVHKLGEALIEGKAVEVPEASAGYVEAYRAWLDEVDPDPVAIELLVGSRKHRYCGFLDLVADLPAMRAGDREFPAGRWLLDLKTGKPGGGVFPEAALQLTGYRHAELFVAVEDGADPEERPMEWLGIEHCGVVRISSDACELIPVDTGPEVWEFFLHLKWMYDRQEDMRSWVAGPPAVRDHARPGR
jgi:hypothetical protein